MEKNFFNFSALKFIKHEFEHFVSILVFKNRMKYLIENICKNPVITEMADLACKWRSRKVYTTTSVIKGDGEGSIYWALLCITFKDKIQIFTCVVLLK